MGRWWNGIFALAIVAVAGFAVYAVWPDEPDRYFPDWMNLPSGRGLPGEIAGLELPCRDAEGTSDADSADCKGMTLGLDLQGGSRFTLEADLQGQSDIDLDEAMDGAKEIIESRINPFGVSESQVQRSGENRLIVELPGVSSNTARDIIRPAVLMFCEPLQRGGGTDAIQGGQGNDIATSPQASDVYYKPGTCQPDVDAEGRVAVKDAEGNIRLDANGQVVRIEPTYSQSAVSEAALIWTPAMGELNGAPTIMTGSFLRPNASVVFDNFGQPILIFNMTGDGEEVFGSLTERITGYPLATFLDGEPVRGRDGSIIAPTVQGEIRDTGQTTGLTLRDARRLRTFLNNGAFPVPLRVVQQQDVDASLGDVAVRHSVEAGLVALFVVMAFMTLYYRLPGLIASMALLVYTAVLLAIFKIGIPGSGPVTLTLAGIAAFVLSIGMAVDANILIFERTREELRNGRSLIPAVHAGFDRAWSSIRDSNISTMITCVILYWFGNQFGSSLIKGFALTLAIGVVVSLFSAITVTRTFLLLAIGTPLRRVRWFWTDERADGRVAPARADIAVEAADA